MRHTFESLAALRPADLEGLLARGERPAFEDLVGWEFDGWNVNPLAGLIGNRKFKKGFFGNPEIYADPERQYAWGYNVKVTQNAFHEAWTPKPNASDGARWCFFKAVPGRTETGRHPNALVIDYEGWGEHRVISPVRYLVDYVVTANAGDPSLLIGKAYLDLGVTLEAGFFLLRRDRQPCAYRRRSHFLTDRQRRTLAAFADAFLPETATIDGEAVSWNIDGHLERIRSKRTASLRWLLFVVEHALPLWSLRMSFSRMSRGDRRALMERCLANARSAALRDLAKIRALMAAGYYGDERVYPSIRFDALEKRPRYDKAVFAVKAQPPIHLRQPSGDVECDVCVIGSGPAGSVVAGNLAESGRCVVLVEEGAHIKTTDITHDEGRMMSLAYKEGGLQTTVDLDMVLLQGCAVGGGSIINNSICLRMKPDVLDDWRALGAVVDRARLDRSFAEVEKAVGVRTYQQYPDQRVPDVGGLNPRKLLTGWVLSSNGNPARREHGRFHQNMDDCLGCGYCNFGCKYGRRLAMLETYIPKLKDRSYVIERCHAERLERVDNRITGVHCTLRNGRKIRIKAKAVVVACGAIGSSVLLMKSGIEVRPMGRDLVGTRFSFNAGTPMFALFEGEDCLRSYDGLQMNAYVGSTDGSRTGDYLLESHFDPPMTFAASLPGWFETHFERMRCYSRLASAGVLIRTEADGRVKKTPLFRNLFGPVDWRIGPADLDKLHRGMADLAAFWFAAGAEKVFPSTFKDCELDRRTCGEWSVERLRRHFAGLVKKKDDLTLSSAHLQGGNPMSDAEEIGVVDSGFRVKGLDNLYVCDASVFPASIGVNPQLSIMAIADYFTRLGSLG